jgi:hypothetical protein
MLRVRCIESKADSSASEERLQIKGKTIDTILGHLFERIIAKPLDEPDDVSSIF